MDDPSLDEDCHIAALRGLTRLNLFSNSALILWKELRLLCAERYQTELRILDLATGGGDIPLALWRTAKDSGIRLRIEGCDLSERAVSYANCRAQDKGANLHFFQLNALCDEIPNDYDVIMTSLFTHHLDPPQVKLLLQKMSTAARKMILVNDLLRSSLNLALVTLSTRLLTTCDVVHHDGPASVRAAYTLDEMRLMAQEAGLNNFTLQPQFPCRLLLTWHK